MKTAASVMPAAEIFLLFVALDDIVDHNVELIIIKGFALGSR